MMPGRLADAKRANKSIVRLKLRSFAKHLLLLSGRSGAGRETALAGEAER